MAGAMVPRGAGDKRLLQQQRRADLDQHIQAVRGELSTFSKSREFIRDHLWAVFSQHLYLETAKDFKTWLEAQQFENLSLRTAQSMIAECKPPSKKRQRKSQEAQDCGSGNNSDLDMYKNPLPKGCKDVFLDPFLQTAIDTLGETSAKLRERDFQFGLEKRQKRLPFLNGKIFQQRIQSLIHDLDVLLDDLQANRPAGVCPSCGGKGCGDCRQGGMVPKSVYERLHADRKNGHS